MIVCTSLHFLTDVCIFSFLLYLSVSRLEDEKHKLCEQLSKLSDDTDQERDGQNQIISEMTQKNFDLAVKIQNLREEKCELEKRETRSLTEHQKELELVKLEHENTLQKIIDDKDKCLEGKASILLANQEKAIQDLIQEHRHQIDQNETIIKDKQTEIKRSVLILNSGCKLCR